MGLWLSTECTAPSCMERSSPSSTITFRLIALHQCVTQEVPIGSKKISRFLPPPHLCLRLSQLWTVSTGLSPAVPVLDRPQSSLHRATMVRGWNYLMPVRDTRAQSCALRHPEDR
ncbi:hypothetical protein JZ751_005240 [Albula glossodonta]|uniref:Uncharacterized protein n=1 Tax=Albula glossodonta TaxID=121402 RepID=A0A8T2PDU1_9TELE|nr:hypothetical protein JZ751_005240 [Albula glossodonta]